MTDFKMTKNGLRSQQNVLAQLQTYLPTLQLKKTLLQVEVNQSKIKLEKLNENFYKKKDEVTSFSDLLTDKYHLSPLNFTKIRNVTRNYENIAGIEIPVFQKVIFEDSDYFLFDTPIWFDTVIEKIKETLIVKEKIVIEEEKKRALEKELTDVSIRVNLFEKILIPRTNRNIKKIKIFLSDQELALISQAKIAKLKKEKK